MSAIDHECAEPPRARRTRRPEPPRLALAWLMTAALFATAAAAPAPQAPAAGGIVVLENANLIDGRSNEVRPRMTVIVRGSEIAAVLAAPPATLPDSALVLDLHGGWLVPGFIDSHVHISHDTRPVAEAALARALRGGVTTVRDMAGDARRLAALQRDAWLGEIASPDIVYAAVFAGETFFNDPRVAEVTRGAVPGETPWARAVRPTTDVAKAVLEAKGSGASAIKIYTDLPPSEIARVTAAAHAESLHVWSHATVFPSRPSDALAAGVDVLSHASMLQWQLTRDVPPRYGPHRDVAPLAASEAASPRLAALFADMKRRGTILDATLFVGQEMVATTGDSARRSYWRGTQAFAVAATRAAHAAGIAISAGTDEMVPDGDGPPNLHEEMKLLVAAGFTPMQALQAATRVSAAAAGVLDHAGTIEPGKRANLVVLGADPTVDIANTSKIRMVIKAGKVILEP